MHVCLIDIFENYNIELILAKIKDSYRVVLQAPWAGHSFDYEEDEVLEALSQQAIDDLGNLIQEPR